MKGTLKVCTLPNRNQGNIHNLITSTTKEETSRGKVRNNRSYGECRPGEAQDSCAAGNTATEARHSPHTSQSL